MGITIALGYSHALKAPSLILVSKFFNRKNKNELKTVKKINYLIKLKFITFLPKLGNSKY